MPPIDVEADQQPEREGLDVCFFDFSSSLFPPHRSFLPTRSLVHLSLHSLDVLGAIDSELESKCGSHGAFATHIMQDADISRFSQAPRRCAALHGCHLVASPQGGFTKVATLPMFSLQGTFSALALATMLGRPDVLAATDKYVRLR